MQVEEQINNAQILAISAKRTAAIIPFVLLVAEFVGGRKELEKKKLLDGDC